MNDSKKATTRIPKHQRDQWDEDAEALGMSRSEFIRHMVQAGRRNFDLDDTPSRETTSNSENPGGEQTSGSKGGVNAMKTQLLDVLSEDTYLSWSDIVGELTNDIENEVDEALSELQEESLVKHSGRNDGYTIISGSETE